MRPSDLTPPAMVAERHPHGARVRYATGCRCDECRAANTAYEKQRARARAAGDWNGLVSAERARTHILALRRAGLGRRAIAEASDVSCSSIFEVARGAKTTLRALTERRILQVNRSVRMDHALVSATRVRQMVDRLIEEGFTKTSLAKRLGYKCSPATSIRKPGSWAYSIKRCG